MRNKKHLAAKILKVSHLKVRFSPEALEDIGKAITRSDIRGLLAVGKITERKLPWQSRARARSTMRQKKKGRQKGRGSRKGKKFSRVTRKRKWITKVRVQRGFLQELRDKQLLSTLEYRHLYGLCKGGFFRNKRHIKLYLTEHHLVQSRSAPPPLGKDSGDSEVGGAP